MQAERQMGRIVAPVPTEHVQIVIAATVLDVRAGLRILMTSPLAMELGEDARGTTELVMAEALNNVVEHAYASYPGRIEVNVVRETSQLRVQIRDNGLPMPGDEPPFGRLPDIGGFDDLPEGGFGWFLIRTLAEDLTYRREDDSNLLNFRILVDNAG